MKSSGCRGGCTPAGRTGARTAATTCTGWCGCAGRRAGAVAAARTRSWRCRARVGARRTCRRLGPRLEPVGGLTTPRTCGQGAARAGRIDPWRQGDRRSVGLSIDTIRGLAMDAVQKAGAGHPGTAMALAPLAYTLFKRTLRANPRNPAVARPRPLRAQLRARVRAAVLAAAPLRVRPEPRGPAAVPPVGLAHAGAPRARAHPRHRGHHGAARPGLRQRRRDGDGASASSPSATTARAKRWSTTTRTRSAPTGT